MKRSFAFLAFLLVVLGVAGCVEQKPVTPQQAQENVAQVAATATEIPLDESMPGAKVDLTPNFYFILDASGTMGSGLPGGGDHEFRTKLDGAKWAIGEFVKKVPQGANLGLFVFGDDGYGEVVPLCADRKRFLDAVASVQSGGNTPLGEAIQEGTDKLVEQYKRQLGYGEYRLIVLTDGMANGGVDLGDAALYATKFKVPIYSIGYGLETDHPLRQYSVSYRTANSSQDLAKGLEETLGETESFDATEFQAEKK
jgi:hypothetical protein